MKKKGAGFEKFFKQKSGAAKKEEYREEKRKWKKELTEKRILKIQKKNNPATPGKEEPKSNFSPPFYCSNAIE